MWEGSEFVLVVLVVFTSPMNFLRLDVFYFTLSDALTCLCLLMRLFQGRLSFEPLGPASTFYWLIGLIILLAGLLLSSAVNGDPLRGLVYAGQYFFAYFILLLVIAGRTEKELMLLAKVYLLSITLMCLHGAYLIDILGERSTAFVSGNGRLTGFVERENECAALIAFSVPILLFLSSDGWRSKLALLALPVLGYALMLTGSNSGLAAFILSIIIFSALTVSWRWLIPAIAIAIAVATVMPIAQWGRDYMPLLFQRRVLGALESGDLAQAGTFDHRVELIREAIGRTTQSIVLGMGADQYAVRSAISQPVHNLLLWTEGGLICMIGFIVMIGSAYGPAIAAYKRQNGHAVAACTISVITLFLISVNAFPSVYGRFWSMPVILAAALSYAFQTRNISHSVPMTHQHPPTVGRPGVVLQTRPAVVRALWRLESSRNRPLV